MQQPSCHAEGTNRRFAEKAALHNQPKLLDENVDVGASARVKGEHDFDFRGRIIAAHQEAAATSRELQQSGCRKEDPTHRSFFAVSTCSGVLREPKSGEGMILSCSRRVAVLEVPAAPCFDGCSFLVMMAGQAVTTATWGDGGELYTPLGGGEVECRGGGSRHGGERA